MIFGFDDMELDVYSVLSDLSVAKATYNLSLHYYTWCLWLLSLWVQLLFHPLGV